MKPPPIPPGSGAPPIPPGSGAPPIPTEDPDAHLAPAAPRTDITVSTASEAVKNFARRRGLDMRETSAQVFDFLREAEALDIHAEAESGVHSSRMFKFGCAMLVTLFPLFVPFALIVIPVCGVGFLYSWFQSSHFSKYDIPDDLRKLLLPVLDAIRNDVPVKGKVRLKLDVSGPTSSKEVKRPDSGYDGSVFWTYRRQYYHDNWGQLQVPLADGSVMTFDFWNEYLKRTRNRKGKVKWKKVSCVRVTLLPVTGAMTLNPENISGNDFRGVGKLKSGARDRGGRAGYQLTAKTKFKSGSTPSDSVLSPEEVLHMAFKLCSMVQPESK